MPVYALATGPFILPFYGNEAISAYFDTDDSPDWVADYVHTTPWSAEDPWEYGYAYNGHAGTDYDLDEGTLIGASASGTVSSILTGQVNTYPGDPTNPGNKIVIDHANDLQSRYYHLKDGTLQAATSTVVEQGESIAKSGNTGYSTGDHLHFEVRDSGNAADPYSDALWTTSPPSLPDFTYFQGTATSSTDVWLGIIYLNSSNITFSQTATISAVTIKLDRVAGDGSCYAQEFNLQLWKDIFTFEDSENTLTENGGGTMRFTFSTSTNPVTLANLYKIQVTGSASGPWLPPCNDWDSNVEMMGEDNVTIPRLYQQHDSDFEPYVKIEI